MNYCEYEQVTASCKWAIVTVGPGELPVELPWLGQAHDEALSRCCSNPHPMLAHSLQVDRQAETGCPPPSGGALPGLVPHTPRHHTNRPVTSSCNAAQQPPNRCHLPAPALKRSVATSQAGPMSVVMCPLEHMCNQLVSLHQGTTLAASTRQTRIGFRSSGTSAPRLQDSLMIGASPHRKNASHQEVVTRALGQRQKA